MHKYFYRTYLLILPSSLVTSPLTDVVICLHFLLSVLWTSGNQPVFYHANNSHITIFFFYFFSSLLFLTTWLSSLFCLPQVFIPVSVTHLPCLVPILLTARAPYVPCPGYSPYDIREASYPSSSLYFLLLSCHLANKSLSDLSVNMHNWEDEYRRHSVYSWAEQC